MSCKNDTCACCNFKHQSTNPRGNLHHSFIIMLHLEVLDYTMRRRIVFIAMSIVGPIFSHLNNSAMPSAVKRNSFKMEMKSSINLVLVNFKCL